VDPSALRTIETLAARRGPWTGIQHPRLEVVARNDPPRLEARLFGTFLLHRDGGLVEAVARRDRARELFVLLLLHPDGRPGREIAELLWPEMAPERALHNLRMTAYLLRRFLGTKAAVRHATLNYRLAPQVDVWVDVRAFETALSDARGATDAGVVRALENALDLYRGPLLGDTGWSWVEPFRLAFQSRAATAALRLADLLAPSDLARSSAFAERAVAIEPSNEAAYERLIRNAQARHDAGALHDAVRRYRDMARDLGLLPNPTLLRAI
jgi:DNA-binding SARP family transcriptional activator